MTENIAEIIRRGRSPELRKASELPEQARRLECSLKVAEKWVEEAFSGQAGELCARAEYTRDQIEEELSRVCFEMEVRSLLRDAAEASEEVVGRAALPDTLLEAYCVLRDAPEEVVGEKRRRYAIMGALMVAQDATSSEAERLEPGE